MSSTADLPPLPSSPLEGGFPSTPPGTAFLEVTAAPAETVLETAADPTSLRSHVHTALALAAFVACVIVRAFDPSAIDSDLLFLLAGGVLGTAGTGAAIRR